MQSRWKKIEELRTTGKRGHEIAKVAEPPPPPLSTPPHQTSPWAVGPPPPPNPDPLPERAQKGNDKNTQKALSKAICQILRHTANNGGLDMRPDGYVLLKDLMQVPAVKKHKPTEKDIEEVVEQSDKQRFSLMREGSRTWIRANQGQSLQGIDMDQLWS